MDFGIYAGDTSKTIYVFLQDSTTGLAKTGIAYNSAGAIASYNLPLAARSAITLATQTVTGAWSSGGFVEVDATNEPGIYRFDLPNAAIASGAYTVITLAFTGVKTCAVVVPLHNPKVNVTHLLGTAWLTPGTAGTPDVNAKLIGATSQTGRDLGASVLLSPGTGTGQVALTNGTVDVGKWLGTACATPTVAGVPEVDVTHWIGTAAATPTTAGVPEVDVTFINGSAATGAGTPDVNVVQISGDATAANNAEAFFDGTGYAGTNNVIPVVTTVNGLAANVITAASIAADAITDAKVASDVTIASVTGAVGSVTGNVGGNVTGSVGSVAAGGITASSIATNAIDADALAADAIAEISDGVWDEAIAGHGGAGSTGEALGAAGSAGDPWTTSLPGSYTGTQAGKILADVLVDTAEIGTAGAGLTNINLPNQTMDIVGNITGNLSGSVGSVTGAVTLPTIPVDWVTASGLAADAVTEIQSGLATAANLATLAGYVDTEVAAIKAKTDNLPTDPADQSAVEAAITAATSPLATAANLATVAGYLDTEIAAILADTNELQTDWANGGRLDLLLDQALAAALLAKQILGNKHTVQLNTPSAGLHTITVRNDDDTATVRTIVYNSATGARTVS